MTEIIPASEATKTAIENAVTWYLSEKLSGSTATIVTQKFITHDNRLIYLTKCSIADAAVPRIKVQVLERVTGGVHETGYQLYGDRRLERYQNAMMFGTAPSAPDTTGEAVVETEAAELLTLVSALQTDARALV